MITEESFSDRVDFLDENGKARYYYVVLLETNRSFVRFKTKAGNEVSVPWHRVLKVKRKGVLIDTELSLGGGIDGRELS